MEAFLIKALQLILALALLVTIHEFGHYIFARMFGMRVDRFYLFFNPWFSLLKYYPDKGKLQLIAWTTRPKGPDGKPDENADEVPHALLSFNVRKHAAFKKNGKPSWAATLYGIGWLPLGGYCSIAGMIDETNNGKDLAKEPEPWEFRAKKPFPRLMVMLAGVIFNFVLAIIIYIGIAWYWGDRVIPYENATEGMDYIAQMHDIGLRDGDRILAVNGKGSHIGFQHGAGFVKTDDIGHSGKVKYLPVGYYQLLPGLFDFRPGRADGGADKGEVLREGLRAGLEQGRGIDHGRYALIAADEVENALHRVSGLPKPLHLDIDLAHG